MKFITLFTILFAFTLCTYPQEILTVDESTLKQKLSVSIKLNKFNFKLDDTGKFNVKIENVGEKYYYLYKHFSFGTDASFTYHILDENNEMASLDSNPSVHLPPPPFENNISAYEKKDFLKLEKGKSIVRKSSLDISSEGIKKPGKYTIVVFYHSPIPFKYAPKDLDIWASEYGRTESNTVTFTVTK